VNAVEVGRIDFLSYVRTSPSATRSASATRRPRRQVPLRLNFQRLRTSTRPPRRG
jgi:hypothetical protein